ncbi:MAG: hypothetical protein GY913_02865 [Proteobacteria bacterium]|nr:hypothetical protein [Pseudomonadota bacterium]MCP4915840.1 hypothetical protein [Pseudomonadota bacterium]
MMTAALALFAGCDGNGDDSGTVDLNQAPVANAGNDQVGVADAKLCVDGSASTDPDGDALSYMWDFEWAPEGSALTSEAFSPNNSPDANSACFYADSAGTYVVSLKVNDGKAWSEPDYVMVEATQPEEVPVADAGADQTVDVDASVALDGSSSYDPKGGDLTYSWTLNQWPELSTLATADIADATAAGASFTPDARGVYVLQLVVWNEYNASLADAVVITAVGDDSAPVANAGEDQEGAFDCTEIQLDGGSSVDPDGDSLQFFWEVQNKPANSEITNASFSDRNGEAPTFYADVAGTYVLSLTVSDGQNWSTPDLITITAGERETNSAPVVSLPTPDTLDAGTSCCEASGYVFNCDDCTDQTLLLGADVTVTDADGDPLTYQWELVSGNGVFTDATSLETYLATEDATATEPGVCDANEYELKLTVTDCTGEATEATTTLTVTCCGVSQDTGAECTE